MADFHAVEARLRSIFDPYRDRLVASKDGPEGLYLELPGYEGKPWGYVGGTRVGKAYVSFYLMGAYDGGLQAAMSPELRKRMQGKTCFNFTKVDEDLFVELERITAKAIARQPEVVAEALAAKAARKAGTSAAAAPDR
jgi:hypothetical protein